jgi:hypothetical protein
MDVLVRRVTAANHESTKRKSESLFLSTVHKRELDSLALYCRSTTDEDVHRTFHLMWQPFVAQYGVESGAIGSATMHTVETVGHVL